MNSKDIEMLFRLRSGDELAQPDFKHLCAAVAKEMTRQREVAGLAGQAATIHELLRAANAQMIETIRAALPPTGPPFPGLDVKELGKLFFKQVIEQRRMIEDESRCS